MIEFYNTYRETIIYAAVVFDIDLIFSHYRYYGKSKCSYNYYNLLV